MPKKVTSSKSAAKKPASPKVKVVTFKKRDGNGVQFNSNGSRKLARDAAKLRATEGMMQAQPWNPSQNTYSNDLAPNSSKGSPQPTNFPAVNYPKG